MKKLLIILILILTFVLSGCATYKVISQSPLLEASIRISVGRMLENNPTWVQPTYNFSKMAIATVKEKAIVDIDIIDKLFVEMIEDQLISEERELAMILFENIKQGVIEDMSYRGIANPGEQVAYTVQVLGWIYQSAAYRLE